MKTRYKVDLLIEDNNEKSDEDILYHNPCLENNLLANSNKEGLEGYCHNYALEKEGIFIDEAFRYLIENYTKISLLKAKKGDIVIFYGNSKWKETPEHFAKIYKTNNTLQNTIIKSKWGSLGIYKTDLYHLPKEYGDYIEIWTKKKGVI